MSEQDWLDEPLDRHGFLALTGYGALAVALGGFLRFFGRKHEFVRPPWAKEEELFLSLCLRCDACRAACPPGIIVPVPITESILNAGTPVLHGNCRGCMLCVQACPTGALGFPERAT